jgi:hypothetical protein
MKHGGGGTRAEFAPVLRGRSTADAPYGPVVVEAVGKLAQCLVELLDGAEAPQPEEMLRQGADEALDAAVALGLTDEGWARLDVRSLEVVLEGVRDELASVVVAQLRALGDAAVADAAEAGGLSLEGGRERASGPPLPDGLSRLVHGAILGSILAKWLSTKSRQAQAANVSSHLESRDLSSAKQTGWVTNDD